MEKKQPKISVIMPIYNVAEYLEESLESVLNQSLKEIEVICVNDGSTDTSDEILDKYARLDKRIVVIHKENTGYGQSMNLGMKQAIGEYIAILEPDDLMRKDMLRDLYKLAVKYDVDFVKSNYAGMHGEKGNYQLAPTKVIHYKHLYEKVLYKDEILYLYDGWVAHWAAIYKKSFLEKNKIEFHESPGASYQDTGFWFQTLFYAEKIYLTDRDYYCYRIDNPNSSIHNKEKVYCICKEYDFIFERLKNKAQFKEIYLPWFIKSRYAGYRGTLERIADEYQREFVLYISREFKNWQEEGLLDVRHMWESDKKQLYMILSEPEIFYEKWKKKKVVINELCKGTGKLYIYGAGHVAEKTYRLLSDENKSRFAGFVVTDKKENKQHLLGIPIYAYEDLESKEEREILIGVSEIYRQEIKTILLEADEKNRIEIPDELL